MKYWSGVQNIIPTQHIKICFLLRKNVMSYQNLQRNFQLLKGTVWKLYNRKHGTIIRPGITCKKIPCYMRDSAFGWLIVENAKIFRSYVKYFGIFPHERNCRILINLFKYVFMNHPIMFSDWDNKKRYQLIFLTFQNSYERKINFS